MPSPSAACQTCKIRRIKCDETRPVCQKCTKSRRICVEASSFFSVHVENRYASGKTKRPRGPRSSLTMLRPKFDLQTQALMYYLQYHNLQYHAPIITNDLNISGGMSECVASWRMSGRTCPMVDLALSSIALAVFARTQRHPVAATKASSGYHHLLQVTQQRIALVGVSKPDVQIIDACLLAISLMGRYEAARYRPGNLTSKNSIKTSHTWSHHDGAMAILNVWKDNLSHDTATFIIKRIRRELIKSSIFRNIPLPDWMKDGAHFGEHGQELGYDRIIARIVNLNSAAHSLLQGNSLHIANIEKLNEEAQELDKRLQGWAAGIPKSCSYERHVLTETCSFPRKHFYSSTVYSYSSVQHAAVWCDYFAARMLLNTARSKFLELIHRTLSRSYEYEDQRQKCMTELTAMAGRLASTIPFCLDRFKIDDPKTLLGRPEIRINTDEEIKPYLATLVVWPLTIASRHEGIYDKQRLWFRSELAILGRITGEGILECADTDQWPIL